MIARKEKDKGNSEGRSAEGEALEAGPSTLRRCGGGAARLATIFAPVKRLKRSLVRRIALNALDFIALLLFIQVGSIGGGECQEKSGGVLGMAEYL